MAKPRNREEAINIQLAILISSLGVRADAETIHVHGKHMPDVLFQLRGLRVVIEGKFEDVPHAEEVVLGDARKRVTSGLAHIATAVIYPKSLRSAPTTKIVETLKKSELKYRIVAETHESDWFEGSPVSIMDALRRAQEALTQDDIVERTARALSERLEGVAALWMGQEGACDRLCKILGIIPPKGESKEEAADRRETAAKVSALVLANAFIFEEQLSATDGRITPLRKLQKEKKLVDATARHWKWIWDEINYVPIFQLGERILDELPSSQNSTIAVNALLTEARAICSEQAALRHDLMGRILVGAKPVERINEKPATGRPFSRGGPSKPRKKPLPPTKPPPSASTAIPPARSSAPALAICEGTNESFTNECHGSDRYFVWISERFRGRGVRVSFKTRFGDE